MSSQNLIHFVNSPFEGKPLTTVIYRGKLAWFAKEIGAILGYGNNGSKLVTSITKGWANEFITDHHSLMIVDNELRDLKALHPDTELVSSHTSSILLLFEPGLYLVFLKTHKPIGVRLRLFLTDEVFPKLIKDGSYSLNQKDEAEQTTAANITTSQFEDRQIELDKAKFDHQCQMDNHQCQMDKAHLLEHLLTEHTNILVPEIILTYQTTIAEIILGHPVNIPKSQSKAPRSKPRYKRNPYVMPRKENPKVALSAPRTLLSEQEIAEKLGITIEHVRSLVGQLNIQYKYVAQEFGLAIHWHKPETLQLISNYLANNQNKGKN